MSRKTKELRTILRSLPRVDLQSTSTPLHPCPRFSREFCDDSHVWIKREDLADLGMGGNKARMLELILGNVVAQGVDVLVNVEFAHSNFDRLLAAATARLGIDFHFLVKPDPVHGFRVQGNLLLTLLAGAKLHPMRSDLTAVTEEALVSSVVEELEAEGKTVHVLGRDDRALGALAFVECAIEILEQCRRLGTHPEVVFLSGHAATHAGLALGFKALSEETRVIAFRAFEGDQGAVVNEVCNLANEAARRLGLSATLEPSEVESVGEFSGGYREMTYSCRQAIESLARTEGVFLDPVYTGKALAGFLEYLRQGRFSGSSELVFLHTGGTPNLFTYSKAFAPDDAGSLNGQV